MRTTYPPTDSVIVAFSGGKESLAVLDLAVKHFSRVEPFFMYLIPGLDYTDVLCSYAEQRFKVTIRRYQHWLTSHYLHLGTFCDERPEVKMLGMRDVINHARIDTGLRWCGLGYRRQESLIQLRWLGEKRGWKGDLNEKHEWWAPVSSWSLKELLAYHRRHRIVIPHMSAAKGYKPSGIGLGESLEWMRLHWPRDYEKILEVFPYARAQTGTRNATIDARRAAVVSRRKAAGVAASALPVPGGAAEPD